jgi:nitroimidazol reductase NimA-like FMN-containing flavoprotein (pyridoxamine 5'-phosphate oxidase superfamily)
LWESTDALITVELVRGGEVAEREPVSANSLFGEGRVTEQWSRVRELLGDSYVTYWLATTGRDGTPHVRPILVVWVAGELYFTSKENTRKAKNLALRSRCAVTVEREPLDLVVEGTAAKVRDAELLQRVADAFASTYDWHVTVRDGAFHDTGGAPTAGPPPYDVYEVIPTTAFGFGLDESFSSTRWRFEERA